MCLLKSVGIVEAEIGARCMGLYVLVVDSHEPCIADWFGVSYLKVSAG